MYISLAGYHWKHNSDFAKERKDGYNGIQIILFQTRARIVVDSVLYDVLPNTVVVIDTSVPHCLYAVDEEYMDDWIRFQLGQNERYEFNELNVPLNIPIPLNDNILEMMIYCCCQTYDVKYMESQKIQHSLLTAILLYLSGLDKEFHYKKPIPYETELRELRKRIFSEPGEEYSAAKIAASMNLSASYLNKIYRSLFRISFMTDVFSARMEYAQTLLSKTDSTVYEIANMCGYNSYEHFSRRFKKYSCVSPQEYRDKCLNNQMKQYV